MQITTAIKQLNKEAEFMGIGLLEVLQDIKQHGNMLYCEKNNGSVCCFYATRPRDVCPG
jgi:hypothetical protein